MNWNWLSECWHERQWMHEFCRGSQSNKPGLNLDWRVMCSGKVNSVSVNSVSSVTSSSCALRRNGGSARFHLQLFICPSSDLMRAKPWWHTNLSTADSLFHCVTFNWRLYFCNSRAESYLKDTTMQIQKMKTCSPKCGNYKWIDSRMCQECSPWNLAGTKVTPLPATPGVVIRTLSLWLTLNENREPKRRSIWVMNRN